MDARRKSEGMVNFPVLIHTKLYSPRKQIQVYYPVIYGLSNRTIEQKINRDIRLSLERLLQDRGSDREDLQEMIGYFEIKTNERHILSLALSVYSYTGGAHGTTVIHSLTFDITTGKQYALKDLFKSNSNYVVRISQLIQEQIKERKLPVIEPFMRIKPDQDYYIADKSLVIYFQLYELVPYAYGFPYFPISIYQIQDLIDEEGPLGKMLG
jgi:hypothetical protein